MVAGRQKAQLGLIVNVAVRCGWCNVGSYQLQWPWQLEPVWSFLPWPKTGGKVKFNAHKRLYGSRKCWGYECFLGHKETWLKRNASNGRKLFFFFSIHLNCKFPVSIANAAGAFSFRPGSWIWIPMSIRLDNHSGPS